MGRRRTTTTRRPGHRDAGNHDSAQLHSDAASDHLRWASEHGEQAFFHRGMRTDSWRDDGRDSSGMSRSRVAGDREERGDQGYNEQGLPRRRLWRGSNFNDPRSQGRDQDYGSSRRQSSDRGDSDYNDQRGRDDNPARQRWLRVATAPRATTAAECSRRAHVVSPSGLESAGALPGYPPESHLERPSGSSDPSGLSGAAHVPGGPPRQPNDRAGWISRAATLNSTVQTPRPHHTNGAASAPTRRRPRLATTETMISR